MAVAPRRAATPGLAGMSDGALVRAHIRGVDTAFSELYARHHQRLVRTLQARVIDAGLAEEFAQEAFTKAFSKLASFDSQQPFWPWLKAIALNVATDAARKSGRVSAVSQLEDVAQDVDAFALLEGNDLAGQCLRALPPRQRWVLVALHVQGVERAELAKRLHITVNALDQLLFRARARLREEYIKRDPELAYRWRLPVLLWLPQALRRLKGRAMTWMTQPQIVFAAAEVATPAVVAMAALVVLAGPGAAPADTQEDAGRAKADAAFVEPASATAKPAAAQGGLGSRPGSEPRHAGPRAASRTPSGAGSGRSMAPQSGADEHAVSEPTSQQPDAEPEPPATMPQARAEIGRRGSTYEARTKAEASAAGEPVEAEGNRYIPCGGPIQRAACDGAESVEEAAEQLPDVDELPPKDDEPDAESPPR